MSKIIGSGAPTNKTPGQLGQEYFDKESGVVYMCTKVRHVPGSQTGEVDSEFEWTVGGGSASVDTSNLVTKDELNNAIATIMDNAVFNILGGDPNSFAIKVNAADNRTVIQAMGAAGPGLYTLYVQKGVSDNPTGSESSCRGICCVNTWYNLNEFYGWIILFDSDGVMYTRYASAYGPSDWKSNAVV